MDLCVFAAKIIREGALVTFPGHVRSDNRCALTVDCAVKLTKSGMLALASQAETIGADKGDAKADFVAAGRCIGITPHVAQNANRLGAAPLTVVPQGLSATRSVKRFANALRTFLVLASTNADCCVN